MGQPLTSGLVDTPLASVREMLTAPTRQSEVRDTLLRGRQEMEVRFGTVPLEFYKRLYARKLIAARTYTMPLTQQHIGQYLGLTVVHVNRVLRSLRNDRIVLLEKNSVTILDLERLRKLARGREMSSNDRPPVVNQFNSIEDTGFPSPPMGS